MPQKLTKKQITEFQTTIWDFYDTRGRILPWRETTDPYKILVSEMMLQQTQVSRVIPKYEAFLKVFPTVESLAQASMQEVLALWVGLGYNRRARYLHSAAQTVIAEYQGVFPYTNKELQELPGVGPYTASAVMTFAYNAQQVLIETNLRTVYIHHFFNNADKKTVSDTDILNLIEITLPKLEDKKIDHNKGKKAKPGIGVWAQKRTYRDWYWALMDYGSHLKEILPNPSRKSKHHTKQSKFKGSLREARGLIIRVLSAGSNTEALLRCLAKEQGIEKERLIKALRGLEKESFIIKVKDLKSTWQLGGGD